jgi:hypothetical protein
MIPIDEINQVLGHQVLLKSCLSKLLWNCTDQFLDIFLREFSGDFVTKIVILVLFLPYNSHRDNLLFFLSFFFLVFIFFSLRLIIIISTRMQFTAKWNDFKVSRLENLGVMSILKAVLTKGVRASQSFEHLVQWFSFAHFFHSLLL